MNRPLDCPDCGKPSFWRGEDGRLAWFSCTACGHTFYAERIDPVEEERQKRPVKSYYELFLEMLHKRHKARGCRVLKAAGNMR